MRERQSVEHVRLCRAKYCAPGTLGSVRMSVWEALAHLDGFVDISDPDISLPNSVHAFQTAEGLRAHKMPDWLQLTGLIHDLGKMVYLRGCDEDGTSMESQWAIVGDTWIVGCAVPEQTVFPEFNARSPDAAHPERRTPTGIYEPGCGLDATLVAFGHDEYMYQVLAQNAGVSLPKEALYVVRYHSMYPWHEQDCYAELENDYDRCMKGWVKLFNQHDLYTKRDTLYSAAELAEMKAYYSTLVDKYLPAQLDF
jgi:inositol oxygenase